MFSIEPALPMLRTLTKLKMLPTPPKLKMLSKLLALARAARPPSRRPMACDPSNAWLYAQLSPKCWLKFRLSCLIWAV